jgi:peptidoglycan/xylan/chitin deacetylase (PgdA/CDA1 family)
LTLPQPRDDLLVLCYHAVSPAWQTQLAIPPQRLARQLRLLAGRGYRGVRFSDAVLGATGRGRRVAVTFDDAYSSVLALAKPILDELGWPATLYVPTDHIGTDRPMSWPGIDMWLGGPFEHELMPMDWDGVRELQAAGWEIGSHTCSHPHLTSLVGGELHRELAAAKAVCERELGRACLSIAYPYGDADERVIAAAAAAGYRTGAALSERPHPSRPLHWPRVGIYRSDEDPRFRRRVSRGARLLERTPVWPLANKGMQLLNARIPPAGAIEGASPALSLIASHGLLIRGRKRTIAVGLLGRLGIPAIHVLWPEPAAPQLVTSPGAPHTGAWMTRRFEPIEQRRHTDRAATWAALRGRAAFVGRGTGQAVELAEAALGHPLNDPHVAVFRASNSPWVKALAFVWHDGNREPSLVVKRMPYALEPCHLRHETEIVAVLRDMLAGHRLAATLPPAPLLVGERDGLYVVVEPVDPLGGRHGAPDRARALSWLRELHSATARPRPWGPQDDESVLALTRSSYAEAGLGCEDALCEHIRAGLEALRGAAVPLVVEHRDFWAGNIAATPDEMRVYDWEWTAIDGRPFFDLWTWELADLRHAPSAGAGHDLSMLAESLRFVERELVARDIDPAFARLTLPAVIGEITFRGDRATGGRIEKAQSVRVMDAAAQLVTPTRSRRIVGRKGEG